MNFAPGPPVKRGHWACACGVSHFCGGGGGGLGPYGGYGGRWPAGQFRDVAVCAQLPWKIRFGGAAMQFAAVHEPSSLLKLWHCCIVGHQTQPSCVAFLGEPPWAACVQSWQSRRISHGSCGSSACSGATSASRPGVLGSPDAAKLV